MNLDNNFNKSGPIFMWLTALIFLVYQFILRQWTGINMNTILLNFKIDLKEFGLLASFYYYGYALMQIPTALLLNRYGPKLVMSSYIITCGIFTLIFNYTNNFYLGCLSRFIVGATSAIGFLGTSRVIMDWFSKENYSRMLSISLSIGLSGAFYAGKPLVIMIENFSYNSVGSYLGYICILIGIFNFLFIKNNSNNIYETKPHKFTDIVQILLKKEVILLSLISVLLVGSLEGFADVWGPNYLSKKYMIDMENSAGFISLIFIGFIIGAPLISYIATKINNYTILLSCGSFMSILLSYLLTSERFDNLIFGFIFIMIGLCCSYQLIILVLGDSLSKNKDDSGIIVAFLNSINMLGGSFFHTSIGNLINLFQMKNYSEIESYNYGISLIPICAALGAVLSLYMYINKRYSKESKEV